MIISNRGRPAYGIKSYIVKTIDEIANIPLAPNLIRPGSTVFVTTMEARYILSPDYTWIQLGSDTGSDSGEVINTIYEGGDLSNQDGTGTNDLEYEGGNLAQESEG